MSQRVIVTVSLLIVLCFVGCAATTTASPYTTAREARQAAR
jgi:outer membrane lipoprotein SlyB